MNQETPAQGSSTAIHQEPQRPSGSTQASLSLVPDVDQERQNLLRTWTKNLHFPTGAQPEIIRADQKDEYLADLLQDRIEPLMRAIKGSRWTNQHASELQETSHLIYLLLTTLPGSQTLGEEYCDLVKLDAFSNNFPSTYRRILLIIVQVFSPRLIVRLYNQAFEQVTRWNEQFQNSSWELNNEGRRNDNASQLTGSIHDQLQRPKSLMKKLFSTFGCLFTTLDRTTTLSTLNSLHLSLFYLTGRYFKWPNRFNGITYISNRVRPLRPDGLGRVSPPSYELLGVLMMIQLIVKITSNYQQNQRRLHQLRLASEPEEARLEKVEETKNNDKQVVPTVDGRLIDDLIIEPDDHQESELDHHHSANNQDDEELVKDCPEGVVFDQSSDLARSRRCTLCLGPRKHQTSLECGHLFCWKCVVLWVKEKPECPLCRHSVRMAELLPLCNF